jgi:hypothetical protein
MSMHEDDVIMPMHRNLGVFTTRRVDFYRLFCQLFGKEDGFTAGRERSFHFGIPEYRIIGMISHLGAMLPVADGIALASKLRGEDRVVLSFSGDGVSYDDAAYHQRTLKNHFHNPGSTTGNRPEIWFKLAFASGETYTGPFVIKSQTGAILATGVTRQQLLDGFTLDVPAGVTSVTISNAPSNTTCTTTQTLPIPNAGAWEMEKTNVETISDHYGAIQAAYTSPVETFVADDVVGIYTGVMGAGGTWLIKGGPEAIAGTTYNGGGLLILTANNTPSSTTIQSGATVQLGRDLDALTGAIANGLTTVQAGATLNLVGANEAPGRAVIADLSNLGNVNRVPDGLCGGHQDQCGYPE